MTKKQTLIPFSLPNNSKLPLEMQLEMFSPLLSWSLVIFTEDYRNVYDQEN